jgi:quinol monooxygenase YgiN
MLIVAGHTSVDPEKRDAYVDGCLRIVQAARQADGCLDFSIAADVMDPSRVNVYERWESRAAVDAFRKAAPRPARRAAMRSVSVAEYEIADERALFSK